MAEAYQSIAEDLGGTTASLSYTGALKSQMNLKKSQMTKNIDNRFALAGQVVNVFNAFQKERFETFQQMIKIGFLRFIVKPYMDKRNKLNSKDFNQGTKSGVGLTQNLAIYNVVNFFEDILRFVVASARRERLYEQRQTLMKDTELTYASQYAAGSFSESMLYMSNIKKAKQKVNSDIISKIKYYDGFFKKIAMNVIDTWKSRMQSQGKKDLQGDASFFKRQSKTNAKCNYFR